MLKKTAKKKSYREGAGSAKYVGGHTGVRIPRPLFTKLRAYVAEAKAKRKEKPEEEQISVSKVVEEILREYIEEAKDRLSKGVARDDGLRPWRGQRGGMAFVVAWHGDPKLSAELQTLTALDNTTISKVVADGLERKLKGYIPAILKGKKR